MAEFVDRNGGGCFRRRLHVAAEFRVAGYLLLRQGQAQTIVAGSGFM